MSENSPLSEFNRDISILAINNFADILNSNKNLDILEPVSKNGLSAIRYI